MRAFFAIFLFLTACQTSPFHEATSAEDLLTPQSQEVNPPQMLDEADVDRDTDILIYALNSGAAARLAMPKDAYDREIRELRKIRGPLLPAQFRDELDEILFDFPDSLMSARLSGRASRSRAAETRSATVGRNSLADIGAGWAVRFAAAAGSRRALLVSIARFDIDWTGLISAVGARAAASDFLILDVRGAGEVSATGWTEFARYLYGRDFEPPMSSRYDLTSPEAYALQANEIRLAGGAGAEARYRELIALMKGARPPPVAGVSSGLRKAPVLGYAKPIVLLIDGACARACENFVDAFEFHPNARRYGEATAGVVQFDRVGAIVLPASRIVVRLSTSYSDYFDSRITERKGILPDIRVPSGQDALAYVLARGAGADLRVSGGSTQASN